MMRGLTAAIVTSLSSCAFAGPFDTSEPEPTAMELATPRLIAETTVMPRSGVFNIAIHYEIEPGWHLYWKNPGDTGAPMQIDLELPEGLRAGEVRWPAPKRFVHAGLLDYIYEDSLTLVIPIHVETPPEDSATVAIELEWLVCKEACLAGFTTLSLTAPVAESSSGVHPSDDAHHFKAARAAWPTHIDPTDVHAPVRASWRGQTLFLRAHGAEAMEWYPAAPTHPSPRDIVVTGAADRDALRIDYPPSVREAPAVVGVVRVTRNGQDATYTISLPPPRR